jgi:uncharacterized protein
MTLETACRTVDWLFREAIVNKAKQFSIVFFGGEPMICPDIMMEVIKYAYKITEGFDITPDFGIITNGTIWSDKINELFELWYSYAKGKMKVQVSVDGIPDIQNKYRPVANDSDKLSSDLVENAVSHYKEFFQSHDIDMNNLDIHACLSHDTLPYTAQSYDYFTKTLGVRPTFAWVMESNWDDNDITILDTELSKINVRLSAKDLSPKFYPFKHFDKCSGCAVGRAVCAVGVDGNIYPCHRLFFYTKHASADVIDSITLGNIYNGDNPIDEDKRLKFVEYDVSKVSDKPCQVCAACNFENTGDMYKLVNYYQIEFMPVINSYFNEYKKVYELRHPNEKKKCDGNCNCNKEHDEEIFDKILTLLEIMDSRIDSLEQQVEEIKNIAGISSNDSEEVVNGTSDNQ